MNRLVDVGTNYYKHTKMYEKYIKVCTHGQVQIALLRPWNISKECKYYAYIVLSIKRSVNILRINENRDIILLKNSI